MYKSQSRREVRETPLGRLKNFFVQEGSLDRFKFEIRRSSQSLPFRGLCVFDVQYQPIAES
jgi:hypothetical protein